MDDNTVRLRTRLASDSSELRSTRKGSRRTGRSRRPITGLLAVGAVSIATVGAWSWWNGSLGSMAIREHCTASAAGQYAELAPDQGDSAATITAVGAALGLPARAATIAIATAIQESKLRNITYGDRDSQGLFQQRPSQGWGTEEQVTDPVYSSTAFYEALMKVDNYESMEVTVVAQEVQRSAFPDAYADHEPEARIIASALTGNSPAGFSCVLRPSEATAQTAATDELTPRAEAVRSAADAEIGNVQVSPAGTGGTTVRLTVGASTGDRSAWAAAHWAVARAADLEVVRVEIGGRQWDRNQSADGWTELEGSAVPTGDILVTVA